MQLRKLRTVARDRRRFGDNLYKTCIQRTKRKKETRNKAQEQQSMCTNMGAWSFERLPETLEKRPMIVTGAFSLHGERIKGTVSPPGPFARRSIDCPLLALFSTIESCSLLATFSGLLHELASSECGNRGQEGEAHYSPPALP